MKIPACPIEPEGFAFGKETTEEQIRYRIEWQKWAEGLARLNGNTALADGHALTRVAYEEKLQSMKEGFIAKPTGASKDFPGGDGVTTVTQVHVGRCLGHRFRNTSRYEEKSITLEQDGETIFISSSTLKDILKWLSEK